MYRIYLKHKNEQFYSLVVNGSYLQYVKWLRQNHHKYESRWPLYLALQERRSNTRYYEES
jgi:hypothetical protein